MPKKKEKGSKIFGSKLDVSRPAIPEQLEQLLTELEKKGIPLSLFMFLLSFPYIHYYVAFVQVIKKKSGVKTFQPTLKRAKHTFHKNNNSLHY